MTAICREGNQGPKANRMSPCKKFPVLPLEQARLSMRIEFLKANLIQKLSRSRRRAGTYVFGGMERRTRTGRGLYLCGFFAMYHVDNVALRRVGVAIFKDKDFVNAVFLQHRESDEEADGPCQRLADNQILLASDLQQVSVTHIQPVGVDVPYSRLQGDLGAPSGPFHGDVPLPARDEEPSQQITPCIE